MKNLALLTTILTITIMTGLFKCLVIGACILVPVLILSHMLFPVSVQKNET